MHSQEEEKEEAPVVDIEAKPEVTFDDFMNLQFQVGEIIACEAVKKSKKLLCSQVKIGSQVKQIVSGIKSNYAPEDMVGKKVMVLVNLKPAKLAGVLSEGMILCAEGFDGELALMTPDKDMPAGAESAKKIFLLTTAFRPLLFSLMKGSSWHQQVFAASSISMRIFSSVS